MAALRRPWLFDELRSRYEHPQEIAAYTRQIDDGLLAEEHAVIERVVPQACRTLVLGCGAGREVFALMSLGYEVTGADISQGMLRAAQSAEKRYRSTSDGTNALPVDWVWMEDPLHIPLVDCSFSVVIAFAQLLSHIPNRQDRIRLLAEIKRVLKPGGKLIASYTDRRAAMKFFRSNSGPADMMAPKESHHDDGDDNFGELERAAGWEEGDLLIWNPSEANLEEPLFFHLHTRDEISHEIEAAGLQFLQIVMPHELTTMAAPDGHLYPFVVAER